MATRADMIARIAFETQRSDLAGGAENVTGAKNTAIRDAITTAIDQYSSQRFRFSDPDPAAPTQFQTVAGQSVYAGAANSQIPLMFFIDYINILLGGTWIPMSRRTPEELHLDILPNESSGFPTEFAYEGNSLILYPVPDKPYTIEIGSHQNVAGPAADAEPDNPWMNNAELLIRCRAKYEIATHVTRNDKMMAIHTPEPGGTTYRAWVTLKGTQAKIKGRGRVRPMAF